MEATKQKHGAMFIISGQAEAEAKRLGNQCFPLEPIKLNQQLIAQTTSIDGGVLMDENATCHAIGVILDGITTTKGDSSREVQDITLLLGIMNILMLTHL